MKKRRQRRTAIERSSIIERWRASGLSARAFAINEGIPAWSLYLWRKQLGARSMQREAAGNSEPLSAFTEIRVASEPRPAGRIEVVARNGRVVRVDADVSVHALRNVLAAVEQC